MRNILITNDDGIDSDGIIRLAAAAKRYGNVWIVAPVHERSAASHCISLRDHIDIMPHDFAIDNVKAFSCSGTPADCVRVGGLAVMDVRPDVVLSGINYGYNVASDVQYSATAGAAFEARFQGYNAIALSEGAGPEHSVTDEYMIRILDELIDEMPPKLCIWNVNFPDVKTDECRGILYDRKVSESMIYRDTYDLAGELPGGGRRYMVHGHRESRAEEGTDMEAVLAGYVSVGHVRNVG